MTVSRKILCAATVVITLLLIICTIMSKFIFDMRTPVVEVVKPVSMEIAGEMYYNKVIPKSAVFTDAENKTYVYVVCQRKGVFGQEYYVVQSEIAVLAENEAYTVMGGRNVSGNDDIVMTPNDTLAMADIVRIKTE